jgi:hypothetical protein
LFFNHGFERILFHEVGVGRTGESRHRQRERKRCNCEELVLEELRNCGPVAWVALEHLGDEAFALIRYIGVFGIRIVAVLDFGVSSFDVTGFKGGSSDCEGICDDSKTPDIDLKGVTVNIWR